MFLIRRSFMSSVTGPHLKELSTSKFVKNLPTVKTITVIRILEITKSKMVFKSLLKLNWSKICTIFVLHASYTKKVYKTILVQINYIYMVAVGFFSINKFLWSLSKPAKEINQLSINFILKLTYYLIL